MFWAQQAQRHPARSGRVSRGSWGSGAKVTGVTRRATPRNAHAAADARTSARSRHPDARMGCGASSQHTLVHHSAPARPQEMFVMGVAVGPVDSWPYATETTSTSTQVTSPSSKTPALLGVKYRLLGRRAERTDARARRSAGSPTRSKACDLSLAHLPGRAAVTIRGCQRRLDVSS